MSELEKWIEEVGSINTKALQRRIDRMIQDIDKRLSQPVAIEFLTFWGDEEVPDDGSPIFVTDWSSGVLENDESKDGIEL